MATKGPTHSMTMKRTDWLLNEIAPARPGNAKNSKEEGSFLNNQLDKVARNKARDEKKFKGK